MRPRKKTNELTRVSKAVKELRETLGMTQQKFAEKLGVSITTVARWETDRQPKEPVLLKRLWEFSHAQRRPYLAEIFLKAWAIQVGVHFNDRAESEGVELVEIPHSQWDVLLSDIRDPDFSTALGEHRLEMIGIPSASKPYDAILKNLTQAEACLIALLKADGLRLPKAARMQIEIPTLGYLRKAMDVASFMKVNTETAKQIIEEPVEPGTE